jgi:outer membrane receptor protein involved in Fe transport
MKTTTLVASLLCGPVRAACLFATLSALHAQLAPAPALVPPKDEILELSPFVISSERETGWSANDTLSATRTKQPLKDVPIAIDAITADFMEDLGLFTADDVANFVSNVYAAPLMENDNQQGGFAFRGLSTSGNLSRNYFRWGIPNDTYNVERIDFGKGSNSLIFGEVEPGGMGSIFTKRPQSRNFATTLGQYNSDGAYRFQLDLNRRLRPNLSLRFNVVRRQEKTFQDASAYKFEGETLAVVWQPFKHTSIRIEGEQGKWDSTRGWASVRVREQSARGLGYNAAGTYYTSAGTWIIQSTLPSIDRGGGNGSAGGEPTLIEGGSFDVTMRNAAGALVGTKRVNGLPMHYNLRGAFDNQARPFNALSVSIEQKAGPVNLELAYNHQAQHQDRNDNSFDGPINLDVNGRPYMDATSDRKRFASEAHAFRGSAAYLWNKFKWTQQLLVASAEYRENGSLNYRLQGYNAKKVLAGTASTIDISNDRGRLRVYLDDPGFYSRAFYDRMQFTNLPVTAAVDMRMLGFFASGTDAADGTAWSRTASASVFASGKYFGGRLQSLVGVRRDESRLWEYRTSRYLGPFNEAIAPPKRKAALPGDYTENQAMNQGANTMSGGLTWALTKDINVYGVYSESFRFQDAVTFDNIRFGPITGVTKEIGLKGSLLEERVGFTVSAFDIDRQNVVLSYNNLIGLNADELEDLMNPNDVLPGNPRYKYSAPGTASGARNYPSTENSTGADLTVMIRPTKGLQLRFTLARTQVQGEPDLSSFRAYYDAAVKRGNEAAGVLSTARLLLDSLDIKSKPAGARASPWSASWIVDYTFARGTWQLLRGVRMGINGSWRDDYLLGLPNGQEMIGGSSHLVHAYIMRDQKIWGQNVRIRAGVKNLTDLENGDVRKTSFTTLATGPNIYRYSYVMPPQYDLSLTVRF